MRTLIDKVLKHFYVLWESLILCKYSIVLEKHNFKLKLSKIGIV